MGGDSSNLDERISHYEEVVDDLKNESARAELLLDRLKRQRREVERLLESKNAQKLVREEVKSTLDNISNFMDEERMVVTIRVLDKTYPNGWRSGDPFCDTMTIILVNGIREFGKTFMGV